LFYYFLTEERFILVHSFRGFRPQSLEAEHQSGKNHLMAEERREIQRDSERGRRETERLERARDKIS
jgi:hypothetical protein